MAPNVAVRLSTLRTSAFTGTTTLPNIRNSSTNVATAIHSAASGIRPNSESLLSTSCADGPVTSRCPIGEGRSRTSWASCSPAADSGSIDGTTLTQVPRSLSNRCVTAELTGSACPRGVAAGDGVDAGDAVELRERGRVRRDLVLVRARVGEAGDRDLERGGLVGGEVRPDVVLHLAAREVGREHPVVGEAERDLQEGQPEHDEQQDDRGRDRHRAAHHEGRDAVPHALADRLRLAVTEASAASRPGARARRAAPGGRSRHRPPRAARPRCRRTRTTGGTRAGRAAAPRATPRR